MKDSVIRRLLVCLFCLISFQAEARQDILDDDANIFDDLEIEEPEAWKEGKTDLPPYPQDKDLLEFEVDEVNSPFRYYLDSKSLAVGGDGVVRYTLVIKSKQGANNLFYEGMRCDLNEYKTYAFGGAKGKLRPMRRPEWKKIRGNLRAPYRQQLRKYYLCDPELHKPHRREAIIEALKSGATAVEPSFFME